MNPLSIIIGAITAAFVYYVLKRRRKARPETSTVPPRPPREAMPAIPKQNDKLVLVKNVFYDDLRKVLAGFCNMYNKESYLAQPRLIKLSEREFAILFPYDIDFEIYCYFINYLIYPIEVKWAAEVTGWATTKAGDTWITDQTSNKKVMLFIPTDDSEYDNVYMTTWDNMGYKLDFDMSEHKLLTAPGRMFAMPEIEISALDNKEFDDFK